MTVYGLFIPRWIRLAMPEDVTQEIALAGLLGRTQAQRHDALQFRLRELRRLQWERKPCKPTYKPHSLRPSKLAQFVTGYRHDSSAHRVARLKVDARVRRAIARKGAVQRWNAENSFNR